MTAKKIVAGIYKITNTVNNNCYIGSSFNVKGRIANHKSMLKNDKHPNKHLQAAFNKYGAENFIFELILECDAEEKVLVDNENKYIKINAQSGNEYPAYNNRPDAATNRGRKATEEQRRKNGLAHKGKKYNISEERQQQLKEQAAALNANDEYKAKRIMIRKANGWFKNPEEFKNKSSESHKGKSHSPETLAKLTEFLKGDGAKQKHKPIERIDPRTGEIKEYESIKAAVADDFHGGHISDVLRGVMDKHGGYYWQFINAEDRKPDAKVIIRKKRIYNTQAVERIDMLTGEVIEYLSLRDVERSGFDRRHVIKVCKGEYQKHKGYFWQYIKT